MRMISLVYISNYWALFLFSLVSYMSKKWVESELL